MPVWERIAEMAQALPDSVIEGLPVDGASEHDHYVYGLPKRVTRVVNLRREPYDVYIGRVGKGQEGYFGNPFRLEKGGDRAVVIARYREWFLRRLEEDAEFRERVLALRGMRLGCFCAPATCHGDVIVEWLEGESSEAGLVVKK